MIKHYTHEDMRAWGASLDREQPQGLGETLLCYADDWRAEVERLRLAHKGLKIALSDCELALQKMSAKRMDAADEVTRLREALRNISLASQNSMSSKEECGSIARAALDTEDLEE